MKELNYELKDLELRVVDNSYAETFIKRYHYSKTCSRIVIAIGEFINNGTEMVNCIVFNYCAGREMAQQVMKGGDNSNTLELARMVSLEPKPKNLESYCIARALNWLKQNMPESKSLSLMQTTQLDIMVIAIKLAALLIMDKADLSKNIILMVSVSMKEF